MWLTLASNQLSSPNYVNVLECDTSISFQTQKERSAATELLAILSPSIFVELNPHVHIHDSIYHSAIEELNYGCQIFQAQSIPRSRGPLSRWCELPNQDGRFSKKNYDTFPLRALSPTEPRYEWEADYPIEFPRNQPPFLNGAPKRVKLYSYLDFQDDSIDVLRINGTLDAEELTEQLRMWLPKISKHGAILCQIPSRSTEQTNLDRLLFRLPKLEFSCPNQLMLILRSSRIPKDLQRLSKNLENRATPQRLLSKLLSLPLTLRKHLIQRWWARKPVPLYRDLLENAVLHVPYVPESIPVIKPNPVRPEKENSQVSVGS